MKNLRTAKLKVEIDCEGQPTSYTINVKGHEKATIEYTIIDKRGEFDE